MKLLKYCIMLGGLISLLLPVTAHPQSKKVTYKKWEAEMQAEEVRIRKFTEDRIQQSNVSALLPMISFESCVKLTDTGEIIRTYLTTHFREEYFKSYPAALKIYDPNRVRFNNNDEIPGPGSSANSVTTITGCHNGDFENGSLSGYSLHGLSPVYTGGSCSFIPPVGVGYPTVTYTPNFFLLTTNGPDPLITSLNRTYGNSGRALRINSPNPCLTGQSVNLLRKQITAPASGPHEISFNFALVMQGAHDNNSNGFFVARLINASNNETGNRICFSPGSDSYFQNALINRGCYNLEQVLWRDWDCATITFNAQAGETYTLEIFVADCGMNNGAHFSYAYVDNICTKQCCGIDSKATCCETPVNLDCTIDPSGVKVLTWDAVPSSTGYTVEIIEGDPACCDTIPAGAQALIFGPVATNYFTIPAGVADCFSWRIHAHCANSSIPSLSRTHCSSCIDCPAPDRLECISKEDGTRYLTWATSANAIGYQIGIIEGDPACCDSIPIGARSILFPLITANIFEVPDTIQDCFSWTVRAKCEDANYSDWPPIKCACNYCGQPENLRCREVSGGNLLSWNPVPNVSYYIIELYKNNPDCCPNAQYGTMIRLTSTTNTLLIPYTQASCFSWKVQAVCKNGGYSDITDALHCSCSEPRCFPPETLECENRDYLSYLSWSAVSGAVYYKVNITLNDPACCSPAGPVVTQIHDVTGTGVQFYTLQGECFSWNVQAVCTDSTLTTPSLSSCSCNMLFSDNRSSTIQQQTTTETSCLNVSPNPASTYINFTTTGTKDCLQYRTAVIYIYDNQGQEIQKINLKGISTYRLHTYGFKPGLYTYKVLSGNDLIDNGRFTIIK